MRKNRLPFRVGNHFASKLVDYAKAHDIKPSGFPYAQAKRIYAEAVHDQANKRLPMSEGGGSARRSTRWQSSLPQVEGCRRCAPLRRQRLQMRAHRVPGYPIRAGP